MKSYDLTVLIPVYNEEFRLDITFNEILNFSQRTKLTVEYIFINDGSVDNTKGRISHFILNNRLQDMRLISYANNRGKGFAFRKGVKVAKGKWILLTDADFSTPLDQVYAMLEKGQAGNDMVYGVRKSSHSSLHRKVISSLFFKLRTILFPQLKAISDTQCGFKLISSAVAKQYSSVGEIEGFLFDMELFLFVQKRSKSFTAQEVPWIYVTGSHLLSLKNAGRMLVELHNLIAAIHKEKAGIKRVLSVQSIERSQQCHS